MLSQDHFYWNMTKKYIVGFSHIFSDIHVIRTDDGGVPIKDILVPITYAGKRKMYSDLLVNPNIVNKVSAILPRISFLITKMVPDSTRKLNPVITIPYSNDDVTEDFLYNPVPYNFTIDLVVWAKNMDDILQIVEQAVTFFNPHHVLTINEIDSLGITRNVPVILNDVDLEVDTEFEVTEMRTVMANMNFTLKGYLYPPIQDSKVISLINTKFVDEDGAAISNIELDYNIITEEITEIKTEGVDAEWPD